MKFDKSMLRLYAVTDRSWTGSKSLEEQAEEALRGGITLLQLREKDMDQERVIEEGRRLKEIASRYQVPLMINDDVTVALACGADGVHVGQEDMEAADVRTLLGPDKILGVTAKTVDQALRAQHQGADYLGVGAVFGSATKRAAKAITIEELTDICRAVTIPVVAIGGINRENVKLLKGSGVSGVAVVSAVFAEKSIEEAVRKLMRNVAELLEDKE